MDKSIVFFFLNFSILNLIEIINPNANPNLNQNDFLFY
jgi:hypothetical protein